MRGVAPWIVLAGAAVMTASTAGCSGSSGAVPISAPAASGTVSATTGPSASTAASTSSATTASATVAASDEAGPQPLACVSVDASSGTFASAGPARVSLSQIGGAIGFPITTAMPDTQSALGFHGYEGCGYTFNTPAGGGQLSVSVVIGTDPTTETNETAAQEFADTKAQSMPRSQRGCSGDCEWTVASTAGIGDSALTLTQSGDTVVVALKADVYIEVGPGACTVARETRLAQLLVGTSH